MQGLGWAGLGRGEDTIIDFFQKALLVAFRSPGRRAELELGKGGPDPSGPRAHAASTLNTDLPSGALLWLRGQGLGFR